MKRFSFFFVFILSGLLFYSGLWVREKFFRETYESATHEVVSRFSSEKYDSCLFIISLRDNMYIKDYQKLHNTIFLPEKMGFTAASVFLNDSILPRIGRRRIIYIYDNVVDILNISDVIGVVSNRAYTKERFKNFVFYSFDSDKLFANTNGKIFRNDFEAIYPDWNQNDTLIIDTIAFRGSKAYYCDPKVPFCVNFFYAPYNRISSSTILLSAIIAFRMEDTSSEALLVIEYNDPYSGKRWLNCGLKAISKLNDKWSYAFVSTKLLDIHNESLIKCYLWNIEKNQYLVIDDFTVVLSKWNMYEEKL